MARILLTTSKWNSALTFLESLQAKGHSVDVLTELRSTPINFSRRLNACIYSPEEGGDEAIWIAHLIRVLKSTKYDLLIPISDFAVSMVSQAKSRIMPLVKVVIPSPQSVEIAADKARSTRLAMELGIPVPESRFPANDAEMRSAFEDLGLPIVVKVPVSSGAEGVLISDDPEQLLAFANQRADPQNAPFCQRFYAGNLVRLASVVQRGEIVASHSFEVDPEHLIGGASSESDQEIEKRAAWPIRPPRPPTQSPQALKL